MKTAIMGSGISGLLSARLLAADHDIHVFETNRYAGGHTNTVSSWADSLLAVRQPAWWKAVSAWSSRVFCQV